MSIRGLLSRSSDEIEPLADGELDFDPSRATKYAIRRYRPGQSGAVAVSGFDDLDEPIKKSHFAETVEHEGLPYGTYKLLALGGERNQIIGTIWSLEDVGSRAALDEDRSELREEIAALKGEVEEREPEIATPSDGFGALFERVLAGDEIDAEQVEQFQKILVSWEKVNREPSVGLLAYELAHGFIEAGEVEMAVKILDRWMAVEGSGSDLDLVELASDGDLADLSEADVSTLAMLRLVDDPGGVAREVSTGLLEAAGEHREGGVQVDLDED